MFKRSTRHLASAAATAGLTLGALAITAPAAEAASPSSAASYTCRTPLPGPLSQFTVPATFTLQNLPSVLTANVPVPAGTPIVGQLDFSSTGLVPSVVLALQSAVNLVLGNVPGSSPVTTQLNGVFSQLSAGAAQVSAQLGSFTPGAGPLPVPIPTEFSFAPIAGALAGLQVKCTLNPGTVTPGPGSPVIVQKQGATIKAKAVNKTGKKAVVRVKVKTSAGQKGIGEIVAKIKGQKAKTKALKNGKIKFVFKNLKLGKYKVKLRFLGNAFTDPAKKKAKVKIVR